MHKDYLCNIMFNNIERYKENTSFVLLYVVKQGIFAGMSRVKKEDTSLVGVRIPVDLRKALEEVAEEQQRTLSQEIIYRLRQSFKGNSDKT